MELLDRAFQLSMISRLRVLIEKAGSVQEQMYNGSRFETSKEEFKGNVRIKKVA